MKRFFITILALFFFLPSCVSVFADNVEVMHTNHVHASTMEHEMSSIHMPTVNADAHEDIDNGTLDCCSQTGDHTKIGNAERTGSKEKIDKSACTDVYVFKRDGSSKELDVSINCNVNILYDRHSYSALIGIVKCLN